MGSLQFDQINQKRSIAQPQFSSEHTHAIQQKDTNKMLISNINEDLNNNTNSSSNNNRSNNENAPNANAPSKAKK